jgi:hypothetical protein
VSDPTLNAAQMLDFKAALENSWCGGRKVSYTQRSATDCCWEPSAGKLDLFWGSWICLGEVCLPKSLECGFWSSLDCRGQRVKFSTHLRW